MLESSILNKNYYKSLLGNYIIIVAFMSMISNPISPTLPNYVPPVAAAPDPDNELTEGPSTTSLNCPIRYYFYFYFCFILIQIALHLSSLINVFKSKFLFLFSFKRIKTPVKGQLCKHRQVSDEKGVYVFLHRREIVITCFRIYPLQCFDYDNYVDINSRRPSWKCPHCSQSVCFTDIRIDRIMVKVKSK